MKDLKKIECPHCGAFVDVTRHGKIAPHNSGNVRCAQSGKRVETKEKKNK